LTRTDLSLSEVAFAVGFADQSHFARRFRQMVGVSLQGNSESCNISAPGRPVQHDQCQEPFWRENTHSVKSTY